MNVRYRRAEMGCAEDEVTRSDGAAGARRWGGEPSMTCFARVASPVGKLLLVGELGGARVALRGLYFDGAAHAAGVIPERAREDAAALAHVVEQLAAYFEGARISFDVELAPRGTTFQREVWRALSRIPYGETTTYAAIARSIGRPQAVRAVGAANGRNPLSIVVPCHRVIGRDGTLTGYAGGLEAKSKLLAIERRTLAAARSLEPR